MFIIEGPDDLGKTTAAKRLVTLALKREKHPIYYAHMGRPDEKTFNFSTDYLDRMSLYAVQDRFHLGGIVWHKNKINETSLRWLEGQLKIRASYLVIFANTKVDWYRERLEKSHRDQLFSIDKIITANSAYLALLKANNSYCDVEWIVNSEKDFPDDGVLNAWIDSWFERLDFLMDVEGGLK
jgi:hypothetical protein